MAHYSSILAWKILWVRSLAGYSPGGHKESDMTEWLSRMVCCLIFFFFTLWLVLLKLIKDIKWEIQFSSATQSCPTLQPHELQHARLPCPSPTPWIYPNSCSLSPWCRGMDNFKYLKNSLLNFLSLLYLSKMISWLSCRQKFIYLFIQ